jgi:hypothetical protein
MSVVIDELEVVPQEREQAQPRGEQQQTQAEPRLPERIHEEVDRLVARERMRAARLRAT